MTDLSKVGNALAALLRAGETLDALPERVEAIVRAAEASSQAAAMLAVIDEGLHPDRDYLPEQAAAFLGIKRSSYHAIPRALLPRRPGGFARGVDLMAYRGDISHDVAKAYKRAQREAVTSEIKRLAA